MRKTKERQKSFVCLLFTDSGWGGTLLQLIVLLLLLATYLYRAGKERKGQKLLKMGKSLIICLLSSTSDGFV